MHILIALNVQESCTNHAYHSLELSSHEEAHSGYIAPAERPLSVSTPTVGSPPCPEIQAISRKSRYPRLPRIMPIAENNGILVIKHLRSRRHAYQSCGCEIVFDNGACACANARVRLAIMRLAAARCSLSSLPGTWLETRAKRSKHAAETRKSSGLRSIGYIAQMFLAHSFPEIVRRPELQAIKNYTLHNVGTGFVWWDFEPPANLPPVASTDVVGIF